MKNKLQAIGRVLISNEFFVVTPFGVNGEYFATGTSNIARINREFEEVKKQSNLTKGKG
jgi:hypothetical protein